MLSSCQNVLTSSVPTLILQIADSSRLSGQPGTMVIESDLASSANRNWTLPVSSAQQGGKSRPPRASSRCFKKAICPRRSALSFTTLLGLSPFDPSFAKSLAAPTTSATTSASPPTGSSRPIFFLSWVLRASVVLSACRTSGKRSAFVMGAAARRHFLTRFMREGKLRVRSPYLSQQRLKSHDSTRSTTDERSVTSTLKNRPMLPS